MNTRRIVCLLVAALISHAAIHAQESVTFNLRGVTSGVTTQSELEKSDRWGEQLEKTEKPDGSTWLEYRFWAWQKVIAVVYDGVVQSIDTVPPKRLPTQKLADALNLGELIPVDTSTSLPPAARLGAEVPDTWSIFRCSDAPGVLIFAEKIGGKKMYAKWMRFYSLQSPLKPYLGLRIRPITRAEAIQAGQSKPVGLFVEAVAPHSPCANAGIKVGDLILEFAEDSVTSTEEFIAMIHRKPIGTKHPLRILREGQELNLIATLKPRPEHLANFQMGVDLQRQGQYRNAAAMYSKAIKLTPNETMYLQRRASCRRQLGLVKEALADANEAVRIDDQSASSFLERARCLAAVKQFEDALADCQQAILIDSTKAEAFATRGSIYSRMDDAEKALVAFDKAIQLDPNLADPYVSRGSIYFTQKKYDRAIEDFSKAVQIEQRTFDAHYMRGWSYIRTDDYPSALKDFKQLITLLPNHERIYIAYYDLGKIYLNQQNYSEAVIVFTEAINRNGKYSPAYESRAKVYEELGESQKAAMDMEMVRQLAPKTTHKIPSNGLTPVFFDDFDGRSTAPGKPLFSAQSMEWITGDHTGKLTAKVQGVLPVMYTKHKLKDFVAEIEVASPSQKCDYGLVFRSDDPPDGLDYYYMLTISSDELIRLTCWKYPGWTGPKDLPLKQGLLSATRPNRLRVEVNEHRFRVYVNGTYVGEFADTTLDRAGDIGLCVSSGKPTTVVFHSFHVFQKRPSK